MVFKENCFTCYLPLIYQISSTNCLYFLTYWAICILFFNQAVTSQNLKLTLTFLPNRFATWPKSQDKNLNIAYAFSRDDCWRILPLQTIDTQLLITVIVCTPSLSGGCGISYQMFKKVGGGLDTALIFRVVLENPIFRREWEVTKTNNMEGGLPKKGRVLE